MSIQHMPPVGWLLLTVNLFGAALASDAVPWPSEASGELWDKVEQLIGILHTETGFAQLSPGVGAALREVPRPRFIPERDREAAFDNRPVPIGYGQTISQPYIVGYMTEAIRPKPDFRVLEIGTGSGYQSAILSQLCRRVYTIERWRELQKAAEARLAELKIANVTTIIGDGWLGWPPQAPFDRIIVTAAAIDAPAALLDQLKDGGRMIIPLGETRDSQSLVQIDKTPEGLAETPLLPVRFVPLVHGRVKRD